MRSVDRLHQLTDDGRAGGIGELGELPQVLIGRAPGAGTLARCADQDRPLYGRFDGNQIPADKLLALSS
jgi:hypothetical protein